MSGASAIQANAGCPNFGKLAASSTPGQRAASGVTERLLVTAARSTSRERRQAIRSASARFANGPDPDAYRPRAGSGNKGRKALGLELARELLRVPRGHRRQTCTTSRQWPVAAAFGVGWRLCMTVRRRGCRCWRRRRRRGGCFCWVVGLCACGFVAGAVVQAPVAAALPVAGRRWAPTVPAAAREASRPCRRGPAWRVVVIGQVRRAAVSRAAAPSPRRVAWRARVDGPTGERPRRGRRDRPKHRAGK